MFRFCLGVHYVLLHTIAHSAQVHREIGNSLVYFSVPTFSSPDTSVGRLASAHALQKYWQQNLTLVPNVCRVILCIRK